MKVLFVEDEVPLLKAYAMTLERKGMPDDDVFTAETGAGALKIIEDQILDMVITDLKLPDITGIDVLKAAKQRNEATQVIVLTGFGTIESAVEAMKNGARDYLLKPVHMDILVDKINNVRELLARSSEAEEFRYAKEIVEDNARKEIEALGARLNECLKREDGIRKILQGEDDNEEKLRRINSILTSDR